MDDLPTLIPRVRRSLQTKGLFHAFYRFDDTGQLAITITPSTG
jgi:hypothetical protein